MPSDPTDTKDLSDDALDALLRRQYAQIKAELLALHDAYIQAGKFEMALETLRRLHNLGQPYQSICAPSAASGKN